MAVHLRLRCAWQFTDDQPRNQAVINPCFRVNGVFTDAQSLCDDLAAGLNTWQNTPAGANQITVKSYDIQGTKPVYPNGSKQLNTGTFSPPNAPPELACCLSFYGSQNVPRQRGRLYIPIWVTGVTATTVNRSTVPAATQTKIAALVPILAGLGGVNVDWIVWSQATASAHAVTNWFIDDGWDVIRSRSLKSIARQTGTTTA